MADRTTLAERERGLAEGLSPLLRALRMEEALPDIALDIRGRRPGDELAELHAVRVEEALALLRVLSTEVSRLRSAIGHHKYGRMSDAELWSLPNSWNKP